MTLTLHTDSQHTLKECAKKREEFWISCIIINHIPPLCGRTDRMAWAMGILLLQALDRYLGGLAVQLWAGLLG
jgi:hypothetical protein